MDIEKRTLTTTEETVLKNDLMDIQAWATDAITGKINACKQRMLAQWNPILMADPDVESIPANENDLIALIIARDDYKNRVEREAEIP
tara:strand:- start:63 stop:326 length:264 start_codon:yes stop_codon:yes gene_type:complete